MDQQTSQSSPQSTNPTPSPKNKFNYLAISIFILLSGTIFYLYSQNRQLQMQIIALESELATMSNHMETVTPIEEEPRVQNSADQFLTPVVLTSNKFTHKDLPGFEMTIPEGWTVKVKSFDVEEDTTLPSSYFRTCSGTHCMHLNISKGDVSLWTNFDIVMDNNGSNCIWNDQPQYKSVGNKWYQISESNSNVYVYDPAFNVPSERVSYAGGFLSKKEIIPPSTTNVYKLCAQGSGPMFEKSNIEDFGILMENPLTTGNPDATTLEEINQMISSMKGFKPGYKYTN